MSDDFGSFEDFLAGLEPGSKHPIAQILRYRQGADPLNWSEPGATKYVPASWQMLTGAIKWTGTAATSGVKTFNLAMPFANYPIALVTPYYTFPLFKELRCMVNFEDFATMAVWWWSPDALTQAAFYWLAVGPVGA
jgi:hypothetical protein